MQRPPYTITDEIARLAMEITRLMGRYEGLLLPKPAPKLRRQNRIKTVQGSLEIEGNTLPVEVVTAILDNKRVLGPANEIMEVKNALVTYERMLSFDPCSRASLLAAHGMLMRGLVEGAGHFRSKDVGVLAGSKVAHVAPRAHRVPELMANLLLYLKGELPQGAIIASCVFHYEFEFIHPFADGNGRMGRLWQHLILAKHHPLFEYVPIESVIRDEQEAYYRALGESDKRGESTSFIAFCLKALLASLSDFFADLKPEPQTSASRLEIARGSFAGRWFSRKEYVLQLKSISTATASRDLASAVEQGFLEMQGDRALARYRFVR
jgi:Fic family protein